MKRFLILATILVLTNFCKSAWGQMPLDEGTKVPLTQFSWTFEEGRIIIDVTVCAGSPLGQVGDGFVYSLSHRADDGTVLVTYDTGVLSTDDTSCVLFTASKKPEFSDGSVIYHLTVDSSSKGVLYFGEAYFAVETKVYVRNCGSLFPLIYRIEAPEGSVFKGCLDPSYAGDNVCYKDGSAGEELDVMNICYTDGNSRPKDMIICQKGLKEDDTIIKNEDPLKINYLAYGKESTAATLMLEPKTPKISEVFVVAGTNPPAMCLYADGLCTIDNFAPNKIMYSVCGLATEMLKQYNSVGTIDDFDVFIYAATGLLLDFGFVNANKDVLWYTATLLNAPQGEAVVEVDTVNIDCTKVDPAHNCYGFLYSNGLVTAESYINVSYNNQNGDALSNTVIVPYSYVAPTPAQPPGQKIN